MNSTVHKNARVVEMYNEAAKIEWGKEYLKGQNCKGQNYKG